VSRFTSLNQKILNFIFLISAYKERWAKSWVFLLPTQLLNMGISSKAFWLLKFSKNIGVWIAPRKTAKLNCYKVKNDGIPLVLHRWGICIFKIYHSGRFW
jgi:hypothetical protein